MSEVKKIYNCSICGNQVELLIDGGGELVCCGEPMELLDKTSEASKNERHDIVVSEIPGGIKVTIGQPEPHVMTPAHFIQWIECWVGKHIFRKELPPEGAPEAVFMISEYTKDGETPRVRAFCNLHGIRFCDKCESEGACEK
ncbi:MAG: desulfoferrodoxin FeS4 iron-binding domain-containing protein [Planctomycetia bacterium]|nr:desulfoferrodoxin FeS4 iron-binding domain-containing protein [Planctomycetia bacterium]